MKEIPTESVSAPVPVPESSPVSIEQAYSSGAMGEEHIQRNRTANLDDGVTPGSGVDPVMDMYLQQLSADGTDVALPPT